MMPTTPTGTTHASVMRKRAPVSALATRSPMSTKPPIAVRMPRKIPRNALHDSWSSRSRRASASAAQRRRRRRRGRRGGRGGPRCARRRRGRTRASRRSEQLVTQRRPTRSLGRRLDRHERAAHAAERVLLLRDGDRRVRPERAAVGGRVRQQADGLDGRDRRLDRRRRLGGVRVLGPGRADRVVHARADDGEQSDDAGHDASATGSRTTRGHRRTETPADGW